jgi:hypothetical protein
MAIYIVVVALLLAVLAASEVAGGLQGRAGALFCFRSLRARQVTGIGLASIMIQ